MNDKEMLRDVLDRGALDEKTRTVIIDMAARLGAPGVIALTQSQRSKLEKEFAKLSPRAPMIHGYSSPRGHDVEIKCGERPEFPPGMTSKSPRHMVHR